MLYINSTFLLPLIFIIPTSILDLQFLMLLLVLTSNIKKFDNLVVSIAIRRRSSCYIQNCSLTFIQARPHYYLSQVQEGEIVLTQPNLKHSSQRVNALCVSESANATRTLLNNISYFQRDDINIIYIPKAKSFFS